MRSAPHYHVGYVVPDLGAGLPRTAWAETDHAGVWRWAYHRQPFGGYVELVELVDRVVEAELVERLSRAQLDS